MRDKSRKRMIDRYSVWEYLVRISRLDIREEILLKDIAKQINITYSSPYFREIISLLIRHDAMVMTDRIGNMRKARIDNKKLEEIILSSRIYQTAVDYGKETGDIIIG